MRMYIERYISASSAPGRIVCQQRLIRICTKGLNKEVTMTQVHRVKLVGICKIYSWQLPFLLISQAKTVSLPHCWHFFLNYFHVCICIFNCNHCAISMHTNWKDNECLFFSFSFTLCCLISNFEDQSKLPAVKQVPYGATSYLFSSPCPSPCTTLTLWYTWYLRVWGQHAHFLLPL